jgi:uncharacterized protein involved in exopolysaccharide biosynthesis
MIQYSHQDSPMSPHSFLSVVAKRRGLILLVFLLTVVLVAVGVFVMPPMYKASAKLMVNYQIAIEKEHLLNLWQIQDKNYYERMSSEVAIVKMRSVLEPAVKELGLAEVLTHPSGDEQVDFDRAVEELKRRLNVEREKDTNVLVVSYEDRNAQRAAQIVDRVVTEYIRQRPGLDRDDRAYEFFDKQIEQIKVQIDEIEKKGMMYKSKEKVLSPSQQTAILFESLSSFDQELSRARAERIAHEAQLKVIREQLASEKDLIIPSTQSTNGMSQQGYYNNLKGTLLSLEIKKTTLLQKYTEKHPEVASITAEIEATRAKIKEAQEEIVQGEESASKALLAQESALAMSMNQVASSISKMSRQEYELGQLSIGIEDLRAVHSMLIRQREEARIANSQKEYLLQVRLLEPALAPRDPARPNKPLYLSLSVLVGLMLAFGVAFFLEYFDHSVNTVEDAQHCLQIPILASIPDFQAEPSRRRKQADSDSGSERTGVI